MKGWKLITLAVALGVVLVFAAVAIARGAAGDRDGRGWGMMGGGGMMRGVQDGDRVGPCAGAGSELMNDADFREDMQKLRDKHRQDMQAWWDEYGADTSSDQAQKALEELRTKHWKDMRALFAENGVELPETPPAGRGAGPGGCGGGCGGQGGPGGGQGQNSATGMMGGGWSL